jgi:hypothetical protein
MAVTKQVKAGLDERLLKQLESHDSSERISAVRAAEEIPAEKALTILSRVLVGEGESQAGRDPKETVRQVAAYVLGLVGRREGGGVAEQARRILRSALRAEHAEFKIAQARVSADLASKKEVVRSQEEYTERVAELKEKRDFVLNAINKSLERVGP